MRLMGDQAKMSTQNQAAFYITVLFVRYWLHAPSVSSIRFVLAAKYKC
jgi:hypothetical protein